MRYTPEAALDMCNLKQIRINCGVLYACLKSPRVSYFVQQIEYSLLLLFEMQGQPINAD